MKKPKVSICMIVKNEEENLKRLLKSIEPLVFDDFSELIIIDTGSTDKTIEIAKRYTDKVYQTKWQGFSKARNESIKYAKGEWIFILDADHEVPYESCINLKKMLNNPKINKYNTISIEVRDYKTGSTSYNTFSQTLIFKNDGEFHYKGKIHNTPIFKYPLVKTDEVYIYHHGYKDEKTLLKKIKDRTLPELLKEYEENPESMHALVHLTQAYSILKNHNKVIFYGEQHRKVLLKFYPNVNPGNYVVYSYLGLAYYNLDKRVRLYETMKEALKLHPMHLDAAFMLCELFLLKEKDKDYAKKYLEKAIKLYKELRAKKMNKYSDFEFISWDSAPHFFYELARIYDSDGEKKDAEKLLEEIINNINDNHEPSYYSIIINKIKDKDVKNIELWFERYWQKIKNKNITLLDGIRKNLIMLLKNLDGEDAIRIFLIYIKTLEYDIGHRYKVKSLQEYEKLFANPPKEIYAEWVATVLLEKYYSSKNIEKFLQTVKFLIGKDRDMDRILKTMLLKLKNEGE